MYRVRAIDANDMPLYLGVASITPSSRQRNYPVYPVMKLCEADASIFSSPAKAYEAIGLWLVFWGTVPDIVRYEIEESAGWNTIRSNRYHDEGD